MEALLQADAAKKTGLPFPQLPGSFLPRKGSLSAFITTVPCPPICTAETLFQERVAQRSEALFLQQHPPVYAEAPPQAWQVENAGTWSPSLQHSHKGDIPQCPGGQAENTRHCHTSPVPTHRTGLSPEISGPQSLTPTPEQWYGHSPSERQALAQRALSLSVRGLTLSATER